MTGFLLAALVCRALDAGSSIAAFQAGAHEVIPWMPERPPLVIAVHLGIGATQTHRVKALARSKPKTAKTLALIAAGVECGVAIGNLRRVR